MRGGWATALLVLLVATGALLAACGSQGSGGDAGTVAGRKVKAVTTTNFITDTVRQIGGQHVEVTGLMGPGVDPHLYKASARDVETLRRADVVFYGGLELEGRMSDLFVELAATRRTVGLGTAIPQDRLLEPAQFRGRYDPHVWFDPTLWEFAARAASNALKDVNPENAADYDQGLKRFLDETARADAECGVRFEGIPQRSRVLVTSHDAFNYFGRHYGFEVVAIQGVSTATEATTADIKRVAGVIVDRKLKTIFIESSVPRQTIDAVIAEAARQGQPVHVGGELYSDSAGPPGTPEGTYAGMIRHNCRLIGEGLA